MTRSERKAGRAQIRREQDLKLLARAVGYAPSTVNRVLSSGRASFDLADRLARHLGCPMDLFL